MVRAGRLSQAPHAWLTGGAATAGAGLLQAVSGAGYTQGPTDPLVSGLAAAYPLSELFAAPPTKAGGHGKTRPEARDATGQSM